MADDEETIDRLYEQRAIEKQALAVRVDALGEAFAELRDGQDRLLGMLDGLRSDVIALGMEVGASRGAADLSVEYVAGVLAGHLLR